MKWLLPALGGLLILSCSKEKTSIDDNACQRVVQVFEQAADGTTAQAPFATISYDDSGRVKTVVGPGMEKRAYTYYPDHIDVTTTYNARSVVNDTYFLDMEGRVVRSRSRDYNFQYNAEGYLMAFQMHNGKTDPYSAYIPYTLRYEHGNPIEVFSTDPAAPLKSIALNYYAQPHQELAGFNSPLWEGRVLSDWTMLYLVPGGYFGKASKDLLQATDYDFDSRGRAIAMTGRWAFRYQCP